MFGQNNYTLERPAGTPLIRRRAESSKGDEPANEHPPDSPFLLDTTKQPVHYIPRESILVVSKGKVVAGERLMPAQEEKPDKLGRLLPLSPAVFEILLVLVDGEMHGYRIRQEVAERTGGAVRLLPGTLYRAISRMLEMGLIEESDQRPAPEMDDERRRYYKATEFGRRVLQAEARRLADQLRGAHAKNLLGDSGPV
jgi:DNA-binding PadR family transcriptional regulator